MTPILLAVIFAVVCVSAAEPHPPRNQAPAVQITAPASGGFVAESVTVSFAGSSTDPEDGPLTGAALAWSSSVDGPLGTGEALTIPYLSPGYQLVRLRATDGGG